MAPSSEPVRIRLLGVNDADAAVQIAIDLARNIVSIEHARSFFQNKANLLFVAFVDDRIAGFLTAHRLDRFKDLRKQIFIYEVDVAEPWRRMGIGRKLMNAVLDFAKAENTDEVFVLTSRSNVAASELYRSVGGILEDRDDLMYVFYL